MQCPQCQHENRETAKFCEACGARLIPLCLHCGHAASPQAKYCEECGAPLTALAAPREPSASPKAAAERRFQTLLLAVIGLLRHERRITYRSLQYALDIDDTLLSEICEELRLRRLAIDEEGKVLVDVMAADAVSHGPTIAPAEPSVNLSGDGQPAAPESVYSAPEAERRQLTVMFCDLVGSTDLSSRLDPEDLREVVRAYQETAAEVVARYEGHIAQYLGDGLLIYFGYPSAHEDDAQRAVHAGLGIVEAMAALNTRLIADRGVELAVRIGIHTGPVVVGEMGGGGRHENLALGETPNIAARLEGQAQSNTAVISQVTAQLVQRAFILEDLGSRELKGAPQPMRLYTVVGPREADPDDHEAMLPGGFEAWSAGGYLADDPQIQQPEDVAAAVCNALRSPTRITDIRVVPPGV